MSLPKGRAMLLDADDFCRLAADLAQEHGADARDYAQRAIASFQSEGADDRKQFWSVLAVLLDDIILFHRDPDEAVVLH